MEGDSPPGGAVGHGGHVPDPDDPTDPAYRAGLEAFSAGEWRTLRFTPEEVDAIDAGAAVEVSGGHG